MGPFALANGPILSGLLPFSAINRRRRQKLCRVYHYRSEKGNQFAAREDAKAPVEQGSGVPARMRNFSGGKMGGGSEDP